MKKIVSLAIMIIGLNVNCQVIENKYFKLKLPNSTEYHKKNSVQENSSSVDLYEIIDTQKTKTKYLIYLFSNKLETKINEISDYNYDSYIKDIGQAEVISSEFVTNKNTEFYKLKLDLEKVIKGLLFITNEGGILYRLLFMLPNEEYYEKYQNELMYIFENINLL